MKKIKVGMAAVLFSILMGIFTYKFIYIQSPRSFIGENITLAYVNEDISDKNFADFQKLTEGTSVGEAIKEIEKIKKYLNGIYIFTETQLLEKEKEFIGIIDTGFWYSILMKDIELYFEKTEFFYVLKNEYAEKYLKRKNLYMLPYRGQFIVSLQPELIKNFDGKEYVGDKELGKILDKEKKNEMGVCLYNGNKEKSLNIKTAYATGNFQNENINFYVWHESIGDNLGYIDQAKEKRSFREYINPNFIYFSVADPKGLEEVVLKSIGMNNTKKSLVPLFQGLLGVKIPEIINELGGEVLFDLKSGNAFFSLKEAEKIKRAFRYLGKDNTIKLGENQLVLEEDYLVYGTGKLQKGKIEKEFTPYNFLYLRLDFEALEKEGLEKGKIEINGYAQRRSSHLQAAADNEAVKSLISYIEKEVRDD